MTYNDDFLSLGESEGLDHASLIYVRLAGPQARGVVKVVDAHLSEREESDRSIVYI